MSKNMSCDTCGIKNCFRHSEFLSFHAIWTIKSDIDDKTIDD